MTSHSSQILNWLAIGFEQPTGSLTESFYFDLRDNEFFSIMIADNFMLDENMNIASDVTTSYTKVQQDSLVDRLKRIEQGDGEIISIPRVPLEDRKVFMEMFVQSLSDNKLIEILKQRIINQDYATKFDFYFDKETDISIKEKWENQKNIFLIQRADSFLNLNNINIENCTLWESDNSGQITIDLKSHDKKEVDSKIILIDNKRPWWKFW